MKIIDQTQLIKVNKEVWETDIRRKILEWNDFSESCFCDTVERRDAATKIVLMLHRMLETLLRDNGITEEQFNWFRNLI